MTHEKNPRVSVDEVRAVGDFDALSDSEVQGFIHDAELIIEEHVKGHVDKHLLDVISKYLAAHFAALKDRGAAVSRSAVGETTFSYEGDTNKTGFASTRFGQQALALDSSGQLAAVDTGIEHVIETVNTQEE